MMNMPLVSVIMSVYNETELILRAAIESILEQTFTDFEFIIVMDSPENETNKKILSEYSKLDERICLLFNEKNEGLTFSLNKALENAKGKYVARLDADDVSLANRLEVQRNFLEQNNLDFIGGYVQTITENDEILNKCVKVPVLDIDIRKKIKINSCVFHPTWFLRKSIFDDIGNYKTQYVEDYEFLLKTMQKNYKLGNIPQIVLKYRITTNSVSRSSLFEQYLRMRYLQKKYFSKCKVNILSIEEFTSKYYSNKRAEKFSVSNKFFTLAMKDLYKKQYFSALIKLTVAFLNSRFYAYKMLRYLSSFR